jgi:mRNA interferase RelE/StbE
MSWHILHTRTFYKDLAKIPNQTREQIENIAYGDEMANDPFLGGRAQKMVGYHDYYKIRFGSYRVGLRVDSVNQIIEFRRVLHRKDIYKNFP